MVELFLLEPFFVLFFDWEQGSYSGTLFQNLTSNTSRKKERVLL